jgi:hypothetical protein
LSKKACICGKPHRGSITFINIDGKTAEHNKHKLCCCGHHSASDIKKNLHYNSTKVRLLYKYGHRLKQKMHDTNKTICDELLEMI